MRQRPPHLRAKFFVLLVMLLTVAGVSMPAGSQTQGEIDSLRQEREQLEAEEAAKAAEVSAADAELSELAAALEVMQARVNSQAGRVEDATRQADAAQTELTILTEDVAAAEAEVDELLDRLADRAISSFMGDDLSVNLVTSSDDPSQAIRMQTLTAQVTQSDADVGETLRAAQEDLAVQRTLADEAAQQAQDLAAEREAELGVLEQDRATQAELTAASEARLDQVLGERASLAALGLELDGEIQDAEDALAARLAAAAAAAPSTTSSAPSAPTSSGNGSPVSSAEIQSAGSGIWVHRDIVDNVRALLAAAEADGVTLAGGGYRDPAGQIAVRKNNCGTSSYAIYEMPASSCSPPTARPGTSMHEQGRAIDFTYGGRIIGSRSGAAWNWLSANAASYGLYNLPSEPWHWSTNGR